MGLLRTMTVPRVVHHHPVTSTTTAMSSATSSNPPAPGSGWNKRMRHLSSPILYLTALLAWVSTFSDFIFFLERERDKWEGSLGRFFRRIFYRSAYETQKYEEEEQPGGTIRASLGGLKRRERDHTRLTFSSEMMRELNELYHGGLKTTPELWTYISNKNKIFKCDEIELSWRRMQIFLYFLFPSRLLVRDVTA